MRRSYLVLVGGFTPLASHACPACTGSVLEGVSGVGLAWGLAILIGCTLMLLGGLVKLVSRMERTKKESESCP